MKIGAQREGQQSQQLCAVCSGPGCTAVASRKAVGTQTPHSCPRVPRVPTSPCSAILQAGRMRGDEEPGTALGLLGRAAGGLCCFRRGAWLSSALSLVQNIMNQPADAFPGAARPSFPISSARHRWAVALPALLLTSGCCWCLPGRRDHLGEAAWSLFSN